MTSLVVRAVGRLLLAPVIVVAIAVLVRGYTDVGDGFAAGVIVSLGVLLQYAAYGRRVAERTLPVRHAPRLAIAGLLVSMAVAFAPIVAGRAPLQHWPDPGAPVVKVGSLELITAVAFDVGIMLLVIGVVVAIIHGLASAGDLDDDVGRRA